MSTFMLNPQTVERAWYVIDAAGRPLGRVAAEAATLLRGKHKPEYTPHVDSGDHVIIINTEKSILTGKKLDQKFYRHHSGYIGGLKEIKYRTLMLNRSDFAMKIAVKGMLAKNSISREALKRLKVYSGPDHNHAAQKPKEWTLG